MPHAFARAGALLGFLFLAITGLLSYVTVTFIVEAMATANAVIQAEGRGDAMRGGLMKKPTAEIPSMWLQYVTVENADDAVARAERNGAKKLGELMDVPGVGRFGMFSDPTGAVLGVITPAS